MVPSSADTFPSVLLSFMQRDGSNYEGLVREGKCHVRGVLRYANGDRYEGEYKDNYMNGLGVYVWKNGA